MVVKKKAKKVKIASKKSVAPKKVVVAEPKKTLYVGVTEPIVKQRYVLQVTADYLRMLQNIEKLKKIRIVKKELLGQFHQKMNVIRSDSAKLYKLLPKYNLQHKVKHVEPKKPIEVKVEEQVKKVKVRTEIDSLEAELAAIEGRLGGL